MTRAASQLAAEPRKEVRLPLTLTYDPTRDARLRGIADGLLPTQAERNRLEQRIADLRQAAGTQVAFRQSLFLLMQVEGLDGPHRVELMRRAMNWWRARAMLETGGGSPWAKSMVAIAHAQAGKLSEP